MKVYFVYGRTESGDDWSLAFRNEPTDKDITDALMSNDWLRDELEAECIQGWTVSREVVLEN